MSLKMMTLKIQNVIVAEVDVFVVCSIKQPWGGESNRQQTGRLKSILIGIISGTNSALKRMLSD